MTRELKRQLKEVAQNQAVKARPEWLVSAREQLLAQISNTITEKPQLSRRAVVSELTNLFVPRQMVAIMRPVMAVLLAIGLTTGGWIASVSATENCLPGEMCYSFKLATEKTRGFVVSVAASKGSEAHLHMEYAAKRAKEIKQVLDQKNPHAAENAAVAFEHLNKSLQMAESSLQQAVESKPQDAVSISKDVDSKSKEIVDSLKEVSEQASSNAGLQKEALESTKLAKATTINTLAMIVKKQSEGEGKVDVEGVRNLVQDKIKEIMNDAETIKTKVTAAASTMPETASTTATLTPIMAELATSISTSSPIIVVTSTTGTPAVIVDKNTVVITSTTAPVVLPPTIVKNVVDQAVAQVTVNTSEAKTSAEKASDFVNNNQLVEAVETLREVSTIAAKAEDVVVNVNQVVKEVSPTIAMTSTPASVTPTAVNSTTPKTTQ